MRKLLVFAVLLLARPGWAADSHCSKDETTVFNCSTGKKLASVCASKDLGKTAGYLQYRFGPKPKPELQVPEAKIHPDASVTSGNWMFSGGGGSYLRFAKAGYVYSVYTAIGRGWGIKEGVAVEKDGKPVANLLCKTAAETKLGGEFMEKAGIGLDGSDFELP